MSFSDILSTLGELRPGKPTWSTSEIPDLSEQVMFVTGGNTGIGAFRLPPFSSSSSSSLPVCFDSDPRAHSAGKETARVLLEHNARVYIACRDVSKGRATVDELLKATGKTRKDVRAVELDLGDLVSVKNGVDDFLRCVLCLA